MIRAIFLFALSCAAYAPTVCALSPDDFASGLELATDAQHTVQVITLPESLTSTLRDANFGDLCVFDARGRQLGHAVSYAEEPSELVDVAVHHFPLEARDDGAQFVSVSVQRNELGAIVRAFTQKSASAGEHAAAFLLDLSQLGDAPREGLTLALGTSKPFTMAVDVAESDDLDTFRPLGHATLIRLEHQGRTLQRDALRFPPSQAPYLRLTIRAPPSD